MKNARRMGWGLGVIAVLGAMGCSGDVLIFPTGGEGGTASASTAKGASTSAVGASTSTTTGSSASGGGGAIWEAASDVEVHCDEHSATAVGPGRVLLVGVCWLGAATEPSSALLYDYGTRTFSSLTTEEPRSGDATARLADGRIALVGESPHVEYFDPASLTFELGPELGAPRREPALVGLSDGRLWVLGGRVPPAMDLTSTEIVDPGSGSVTAGPELLEARYRAAVLPVGTGGAWLLGGESPDAALESTERSACTSCAFEAAPPLPGFAGDVAAVERGGEVAVFGAYAMTWRSGEVFDPSVDLDAEIFGPAATVTPAGRFVAAGVAGYSNETRVLEAAPHGGAWIVASRADSGADTSLTSLGDEALLVVSNTPAILHLP
ncbi:MAG: hypothetical protein U0414_38000 [Polyangiaceae bacterium]